MLAVEKQDGSVHLVRLFGPQDANQAASAEAHRTRLPVAVGEVAFVGTEKDVPYTLMRVNRVIRPVLSDLDLYEQVRPTGLLGRLVPIQKAAPINPLTPGGFDRSVASLASIVRGATGPLETEAIRKWLSGIGVRWSEATDAQLLAAGRSLNAAIQKVASPAWDAVKGKIKVSAQRMATDTRQALVGQHDWPISMSLSRPDRAAIDRSVATNAHYIRDYYGRVAPTASEEMRRIVEAGLEEGRGSYEIGRRIKAGVGKQVGAVGDSYYNIVSNAVVGRSRSFSQLGSFRDAGITRYIYDAVLDEVTTPTCAYLHGRTLEVDVGLGRFAAADAMTDPTDIRYEMPWTTERIIRDGADVGKTGIYVPGRDGDRLMAVIERRRSGRDDIGTFSRGMGARELQNAHIGPPPLHGR